MAGRLVWAKAPKNNLWWPSKTVSPEDMNVQDFMDKKKPDSVLIYFFGYHNVHWINENYVKEYSPEYLDQDMPRMDYELFKLALKEVEKSNNNNNNNNINIIKQQHQQQSIKSYQQSQLNSDDDDNQMTICEDDEDEIINQENNAMDDEVESLHRSSASISSEDDYDSHLLTRMKRGRSDDNSILNPLVFQNKQSQPPFSLQNKQQPLPVKSQPSIQQQKRQHILHQDDEDDENNQDLEYSNHHHHQHHHHVPMELELTKDGASQDYTSPLKKKKTIHPPSSSSRVHDQSEAGSDDHHNSSDPDDHLKDKEQESSSPVGSGSSIHHSQKSESPTNSIQDQVVAQQQQQQQQQQDSSSSPQLNSKRLLLTKPPRSPSINSRGTKPVVVSNNQGNNASPSITTISKPIASPPTRSATSQSASPFSLSSMPRAILPNSPPILPSKLPQAIVSSLMQKKGIQASPNLQAQPSPGIHPKTPITLSIPRFKKTTGASPSVNSTGSNNTITSPSIQSMNAATAPSPLHGPTSPFPMPQRKGMIYPQSPSMINQMRPGSTSSLPGGPGMIRPPNMHGADKQDLEQDSHGIHPTQGGTPILAPGYQLLPYFMPPFSLNSSLNMETVFTSPFNGRLAIKGSVESGFQIDLNLMGKNLQGFLTEVPHGISASSNTSTTSTNQPISTPTVKPVNATQTPIIGNGSAIPPGMPPYDYQMFEVYRQMQEFWMKAMASQANGAGAGVPPGMGMFPPFFNPYAAAGVPMPGSIGKQPPLQANGNSNNSNSGNNSGTSTQSTPTQAPKTPNIVINIAKDDQPASIESTTTPTITSMTNSNNSGNSQNSSGNSSNSTSLTDNSHFIQYKQNALQKIEEHHKSQILKMLSKQDDSSSALLEQYEKDKAMADGNAEKLATLKAKYSEDVDRMQSLHKDQRNKLEETHAQQSARFPREVEKQYMLLLKQRQTDTNKLPSLDRSPLNSPTLTPFISPSPSPSPSLSSFMGNSPMITPASLMKGSNTLYPPGSVSHSLTPSSAHSSSHNGILNQSGNSNDSSLPPLSLSSNSPPRSPNEQALSLQKKNSINNSNNNSSNNNKSVEMKEKVDEIIEEETINNKISVNSNSNTNKKSHTQSSAPALTIS